MSATLLPTKQSPRRSILHRRSQKKGRFVIPYPSLQFNVSLTYGPIVYGYFRHGHCLYVGKSSRGLGRITGTHHVIDVKFLIENSDMLQIWYTNPTDILKFEKALIKHFRPVYNLQYNEAPLTCRASNCSNSIPKDLKVTLNGYCQACSLWEIIEPDSLDSAFL